MPWSVPTYLDTPMGGNPSNARVAMFELCRAVNERQGALLLPKTLFRRADGTTGSDLPVEDFAYLEGTGELGKAWSNLNNIRLAVLAMIESEKFVTSSGGTTPWTVSSMGSEIGADLGLSPNEIQDAAYWQAMQDALDRLKYCLVDLPVTRASTSGTTTDTAKATAQLAWDARNEIILSSSPWDATWFVGAFLTAFRAGRRPYSECDVDVPDYGGTIVGGAYRVSRASAATFDIDYSVGGVSGVLLSGASGTVWHEWESIECPLGETTSRVVQFDTAEPSTNPFSSTGTAGILFFEARGYLDLSDDLSDQA